MASHAGKALFGIPLYTSWPQLVHSCYLSLSIDIVFRSKPSRVAILQARKPVGLPFRAVEATLSTYMPLCSEKWLILRSASGLTDNLAYSEC